MKCCSRRVEIEFKMGFKIDFKIEFKKELKIEFTSLNSALKFLNLEGSEFIIFSFDDNPVPKIANPMNNDRNGKHSIYLSRVFCTLVIFLNPQISQQKKLNCSQCNRRFLCSFWFQRWQRIRARTCVRWLVGR